MPESSSTKKPPRKSSKKLLPKSRAGARFLAAQHPRLGAHIKRIGAPKLYYEPERTVFEALAHAIAHQQLHGKAAQSIFARFAALFANGVPEAKAALAIEEEKLRACGLSATKARAIRDLALKVADGTVPSRETAQAMSNEELIERITRVKGIGQWTVEIFLLFTLGRPDIFPVHDYGVRKGYAVLFGKRKMPTPRELAQLTEKFSPHRSTLAWYLWRAADLKD